MSLALIFIGGGIGSVLRYLVNMLVKTGLPGAFPYGIIAINITGSLIIGLVAGLLKKHGGMAGFSAESVTTFVMAGLLGGFTTFSAFSLDVINLLEQGKVLQAGIYIIASVILSILAAYTAYSITA